MVRKIQAYQSLSRTPPSVSLVQNIIKDILTDRQPIPMTVDKIMDEVCRTFGVTAADIKSKKRNQPISKARQVTAYIIREVTSLSMNEIGDHLGARDHSTIVYAIKAVEKDMKKDSSLRSTVTDIIQNVKSAG